MRTVHCMSTHSAVCFVFQINCQESNGLHVDVETGITPLTNSTHSQNGNIHSRGNSADLT